MLAKKERLNRAEFSRFFSGGTRYHSSFFTIVFSPHAEFHASVVVPKKILSSAVKRNKLRRRTYDALRTFHIQKHITGVYIMLTKSQAVGAPYLAIRDDLEKFIGRMK